MTRVKTDNISIFIDEGVYLPTKTLYIGSDSSDSGDESGVDYKMAEKAIKGLHILDTTAVESGITILMNNIGGDVVHGMAIYDAIKSCKSHITVKVVGHAMSMGSIILQAADDRIITPNSVIMIHYGDNSPSGHAKNVERFVDWMKKYDVWMEQMFLERIKVVKPKMTLEQFKKEIIFDKYISATEALELNLVDGIAEHDGTITRRPKKE